MTVTLEWSVEYHCTNAYCGNTESASKNDPAQKTCPDCGAVMELKRSDTSQRRNRGRHSGSKRR